MYNHLYARRDPNSSTMIYAKCKKRKSSTDTSQRVLVSYTSITVIQKTSVNDRPTPCPHNAVNNDVTPTTYYTQQQQNPSVWVALHCTGHTIKYTPLYTIQHCNLSFLLVTSQQCISLPIPVKGRSKFANGLNKPSRKLN